MFPQIRLRRNRRHAWLRDIVAENSLSTDDLIYPLFVIEGKNIKEQLELLPDTYRYTIDLLILEVEEAVKLGIKAVALFPSLAQERKDESASEAFAENNLVCRAIRAVKNLKLDIGIICDVALDPYTSHGHDGIWSDGDVDNDLTLSALCKQALVLAKAGVDILAPSDMMDGRIAAIRGMLELNGFHNVGIISYAAKYASNLYNPFRQAVNSKGCLIGDKKTYQIDYRNSSETLREIELDIAEGADIIMVKPGVLYLDIICRAKQQFNIPIFAYQVSGEYAILKFAAQNGCIDYNKVIIETLIAFKRAGAKCIFTYAAKEVAIIINDKQYE